MTPLFAVARPAIFAVQSAFRFTASPINPLECTASQLHRTLLFEPSSIEHEGVDQTFQFSTNKQAAPERPAAPSLAIEGGGGAGRRCLFQGHCTPTPRSASPTRTRRHHGRWSGRAGAAGFPRPTGHPPSDTFFPLGRH